MATVATLAPETFEQAAEALAAASADGHGVRIAGAGTKPWGAPGTETELELRTTALDRILAHDAGDMTASLQAGVRLADAQRAFAAAGQMLALDPPLGLAAAEPSATIGGIVATGDSGPLAHRYGPPRDLVVGATVALADGTIARSGGTVIKNVAGYDIAKLLCGSFGTLGLILSVNVRLHPLPPRTATAVGSAADADVLARAAVAIASLPAELEALDVAWEDGGGRLLARCAGPEADARTARVADAMREQGLDGVEVAAGAEADEPLWERQRAAQRCADRAVVRIAAVPTALGAVLAAARDMGGSVVGRVARGESYLALSPTAVAALRSALPAGAAATVLDCPPDERAAIAEPWGEVPAPTLALMRAVKARFDPGNICNPGRFVGGI